MADETPQRGADSDMPAPTSPTAPATPATPATPITPGAPEFIPPSINTEKLDSGASYTYHAPLPDAITADKSTPCILGVDEAGRGPVLGPMVYAVAYMAKPHEQLLRDHKFDDSKKLTAAVRTALLRSTCTPGSALHGAVGWAATLVSPRDISAGMLRGGGGSGSYNLNAQAYDTTADLIRGVQALGVNVAEIYVDTVGPAAAYQARLAKMFPSACVTVAAKADSLYPIVSAASVCAKVTRDAALDSFASAAAAAVALGSGYPGDERTKLWLRRTLDPVFGWDRRLARFSWRTVRDLMEGPAALAADAEWPGQDSDDDCDGGDDARKITGFYGGPGRGPAAESAFVGWYGQPVGSDF